MTRFTVSLPDDFTKQITQLAKQKNCSRNQLIYSILNDVVNGNELILCGKYRLMILRLLERGHETNIPQEARDAAYDLLEEAFGEDDKGNG